MLDNLSNINVVYTSVIKFDVSVECQSNGFVEMQKQAGKICTVYVSYIFCLYENLQMLIRLLPFSGKNKIKVCGFLLCVSVFF